MAQDSLGGKLGGELLLPLNVPHHPGPPPLPDPGLAHYCQGHWAPGQRGILPPPEQIPSCRCMFAHLTPQWVKLGPCTTPAPVAAEDAEAPTCLFSLLTGRWNPDSQQLIPLTREGSSDHWYPLYLFPRVSITEYHKRWLKRQKFIFS